MPYNFQEITDDIESNRLDINKRENKFPQKGKETRGDETRPPGRNYRFFQYTEIWAELEYEGVGDHQSLRQLWNKCDPPQPLQQVAGTLPSSYQLSATPDLPPPDGKKNSRTGVLYMDGYKVKGNIYKRVCIRQEKTMDGGTTWTFDTDVDVKWYVATVAEETHQTPLVTWQKWTSTNCGFGLNEEIGMIMQEEEYNVYAAINGGGLIEGKPLEFTRRVSVPLSSALVLSEATAMSYSLTGDALEIAFLRSAAEGAQPTVLGRIHIDAFKAKEIPQS
jgi:hypothetical protein